MSDGSLIRNSRNGLALDPRFDLAQVAPRTSIDLLTKREVRSSEKFFYFAENDRAIDFVLHNTLVIDFR